MIEFVVFFLVYLVLNVFENFFRDSEKFCYLKYPDLAKNFQRKWKTAQYIQWCVVLIFITYLLFGFKLIPYLILIVLSLVWNVVYDGLLNVMFGKPFYRISDTTQSRIEKFLLRVLGKNPLVHKIFRLTILLFSILILNILWRKL